MFFEMTFSGVNFYFKKFMFYTFIYIIMLIPERKQINLYSLEPFYNKVDINLFYNKMISEKELILIKVYVSINL